MQTRTVTIYTGARIKVPEHIQRIDTGSTHGWQLRYGQPTQFFSDSAASNGTPRGALALAIAALRKRVAKMPAPTGLQRKASAHKQNDLPVGISGPIARTRPGRGSAEYRFSVNLPIFGQKPVRRTIYIGSDATYTKDRVKEALARAIEMRKEAEANYQKAATKAKRRDANKM